MPIHLAQNATIAGRFRLNHIIGRGGMGSVWHATHLGLDVPCAVKFMEGDYARVPEAQARFEREAKAAATLRSPHVVQILDHGVFEETPYIAMELLEGEDLGKRLEKAAKLTPRETFEIATQVGRALGRAHALGIVHRDLKPENVFLVRDDDREIAKVLDFGIAKDEKHAVGGSTTKTGAMLGTPYYMSPEQAQGTKSVDFRSDLWSLGVIVYQCITGTLPFESEALGDLLVKIIVSPLPVPSKSAEVPIGFDRWWAKVAARDPAARFQSAKELSDALGLVCGISQGGATAEGPDARGTDGSQPPWGAPPARAGTPAPEQAAAAASGATLSGVGHDEAKHALPRRRMPLTILAIGAAFFGALAVTGALLSARTKVSTTSAPSAAGSAEVPSVSTAAKVDPAASVSAHEAPTAVDAPAESAVTLTPVSEPEHRSVAPPAPRPAARNTRPTAPPPGASTGKPAHGTSKSDLGF
jgi:serine/threonine-protein kinase